MPRQSDIKQLQKELKKQRQELDALKQKTGLESEISEAKRKKLELRLEKTKRILAPIGTIFKRTGEIGARALASKEAKRIYKRARKEFG